MTQRSGSVEPEGEVGVIDLVGGPYAVLTHKGPYVNLGKTYQQIYGGWLPRSGYDLRDDPTFEHYLNSARDTKPSDLETVVHVPLSLNQEQQTRFALAQRVKDDR